VVTADGKLLRASEQEHPGLFWAIRGGGGNFGVATAFALELHPVGPEVLAGLVVHPFSDAKAVLEGYRKLTAKAPAELTCWTVMRQAPPLPFLPPAVHGTPVLVLAMCYAGDMKRGEKAVAPLRGLGKPIADVVGPSPFVGWQAGFDPLLTPGARNYWKSHDFVELSDDFLALLRTAIGELPTGDCEIFIGHLGGAVNQIPVDATAYPHRDVNYVMNVHTRWNDRKDDARCIAWARNLFDQSAKYATGGVYVNFMPEDETQRVQKGAYGRNFARLAKLKAKYDPKNLFRMNQNIAPLAGR
jgi:FAD/FMN-containing dehydrogenase